MKQEQLQDKLNLLKSVIHNLENDVKENIQMFAITVENTSNPDNVFNIETNATNSELINKYGSAKDFFEHLYKNGVKSIRVVPKKRNGTFAGGTKINWKNSTKIQPVEITFVSDTSDIKVSSDNNFNNNPVQQQPVFPMLNGLGMADYHKIFDHQRLVTENSDLKAKNEILLKENQRLEKEVLTNELLGTKSVEKAKATAEMLEKGQGYLPALIEFLKTVKSAPAPALGQPDVSKLSQIKQIFLNADDDFLQELFPVGKGLQNKDFVQKLNELLVEFNLVENVAN